MQPWSQARANQWYQNQPWMLGCNFIPSTAVNQLEMWQAATFDPRTVDRELGWAADLGMNTVRGYLHNLPWSDDRDGFVTRIEEYLGIAARHGIRTAFVFFDDNWNPDPQPGLQPDPVPGVHNSRWVQSPGADMLQDRTSWSILEDYVRDVVGAFGEDERIVFWDLYNEPGNSELGNISLPLLSQAFEWARSEHPSQPLTAGFYSRDVELNAILEQECDIISFHHFEAVDNLANYINELRELGRPVLCTEWLRRGVADVAECLPLFYKKGVGALNSGLVRGKTQTYLPWDSCAGDEDPEVWMHDLLWPDGTPFREEEVELFRRFSEPM